MELNKHFTITYYAKKHKKHISRQAMWDSLCKSWTSKKGSACLTYFGMTQTTIVLVVVIIR